MRHRIGEKLVCKKDLTEYYANIEIGHGVFKSGKVYSVSNIENRHVSDNYFYIMYYINGGAFYYSEELSEGGFFASHTHLLGDYFYTLKEYRKMKLDKMYESR